MAIGARDCADRTSSRMSRSRGEAVVERRQPSPKTLGTLVGQSHGIFLHRPGPGRTSAPRAYDQCSPTVNSWKNITS